MQDQKSIKMILREAKNIVVIGASSKPYRTSHHISSYLLENGYTIYPVNPNETEVLGKKSMDSVFGLPEGIDVDVMLIFRNKQYTADMVRDITEWGEKHNQKPVIWTQLNVSSESAKQLAESKNHPYVENKCMMVEHGKYIK